MIKRILTCMAAAMLTIGINAQELVYGTNNGKQVRLTRQVEKKVLIEEFTSMGCSNCPRGFIGLEKAEQIYGDKVILVAVHYNDRLKCAKYINQINKVSGFPKAHIDRYVKAVDPFYGSNYDSDYGFGKDLETAFQINPVAEVKAGGSVEGDILTLKADVKFLFSGDANYSVAFVVTEDGMYHEKWTQRNGLVGSYSLDPLFDKWVNGTDPMHDIVFDHVAITAIGIDEGIEGSIPSTVTEEENISYETTYDISSSSKIMNRENLNVIALVFDNATGCVVNSDIIPMSEILAIDGVEADNEDVKKVARYTADGRMVTSPVKGLNIIKMSDGTAKKVMVK